VIYAEMKTDHAKDTSADLCHAVAALVQAHDLVSQVVVVSFNLGTITRIKTLDSGIRTGALFEPGRHPMRIVHKHPMIAAALECGADEILLHRLIANRRNIELSRGSNLLPVVWTVDDAKWVRRAPRLGIHGIITNEPGALIAVSRAGSDERVRSD